MRPPTSSAGCAVGIEGPHGRAARGPAPARRRRPSERPPVTDIVRAVDEVLAELDAAEAIAHYRRLAVRRLAIAAHLAVNAAIHDRMGAVLPLLEPERNWRHVLDISPST